MSHSAQCVVLRIHTSTQYTQYRLHNTGSSAATLQDLSSHVMYRLSRARLMAGILSFTVDDTNNAKYKAALKEEVELFAQEYRTLL